MKRAASHQNSVLALFAHKNRNGGMGQHFDRFAAQQKGRNAAPPV